MHCGLNRLRTGGSAARSASRSVAHPERRLAEAAKFGLAPAIAPEGAGRGALEAATVGVALRAALGAPAHARAA